MRRWVCAFTCAGLLAIGLWACGGTNSSTAATTSPSTTTTTAAPTVSSVTVSGLAPSVSATAQFAALAIFSNGTTQSVTSQATWQSSPSGVATVTSAGLVTGIAGGETDIIATYQSVTGKTHIAVASTTGTTFTVSGTVTDATSSGVLPNVAVAGAGRSTTTDGSGTYAIAGVSSGNNTFAASATGYVTSSATVTVGGNTRQDFVLARVATSPTPTPTPTPAPTPTPTPTPTPSPIPTPPAGSNICTVTSSIAASCGTATAVCSDQTYSCSQNRSGTCSSHGGVSCFICPGPLCS
jgi:hypothetical protein